MQFSASRALSIFIVLKFKSPLVLSPLTWLLPALKVARSVRKSLNIQQPFRPSVKFLPTELGPWNPVHSTGQEAKQLGHREVLDKANKPGLCEVTKGNEQSHTPQPINQQSNSLVSRKQEPQDQWPNGGNTLHR